MNYARRQQYRRLLHAGRLTPVSAVVALLGLFVVSAGAVLLGGLLVVVAAMLGLRARQWLSLARRSQVGARSEAEVRRALAPLDEHGWRLRHAVRWSGVGDIDSAAIAPSGIGFAIETKTRTYDERQLGRVREQARWLDSRRRRWCCRWALPVLCVVRATGVERYEQGVLVVSIDRLVPVLWEVANKLARAQSMQLGGRSVA
jgi:hypothetical protein